MTPTVFLGSMTSMRAGHLIVLSVLLLIAVLGLWIALSGGHGPGGAPAAAGVAPPVASEVASEAAGDRREAVAGQTAGAPLAEEAAPGAEGMPTAPAGLLRVLVRDSRGGAVPQSRVAVGEHERTTGRDGVAELELAARRWFVRVGAPETRGLQPRTGWQTVRADVTTEVTIVLRPAARTTFWCRLVTAEDGRPLAGVDVEHLPGETRARSDAQGFVQVAMLDEGSWLDVRMTGRSPCRVVVDAAHETRQAALLVPIAPGGALQVRVQDPAGAPVAGLALTLRAYPWQLQRPKDARARGEPLVWEATSDYAGRLGLVDLPLAVALEATAQVPAGYAALGGRYVTLATTQEERTIELAAAGEIRGRVLGVDGQPLAGVRVQANAPEGAGVPRELGPARREHRGETGADGTFRIGALGQGRWWVGVNPDDDLRSEPVAVQLPPNGSVEVELQVVAGLVVAGRALRPDGHGAAGLSVDLLIDGDYSAGAETDAVGRFRFTNVPAGPCALTVGPYEGELGLPAPATVTAGDEDVELRLVPAYGALSGRLEGSGDVWVIAYRRGGEDAIGARCDLDGTFYYRGLRVGTWDLRAFDRAGRVAWVTNAVVVGGQETGGLVFSMGPSGLLRPRHASADEFVVCRGERVGGRDNLQPGALGEKRVPPGAWTVIFLRQGRELARREVVLAAGTEQVVDGGG